MIRLLLAVLGLVALADRADASGCHVPDRPTFGLTDEPSAPSTPDLGQLADPPPDFRHAPCPGDPAGFPSKFQIPQDSLSTSTPPLALTTVNARWDELTDLGHSIADRNPLERPPRHLPAL